MAPAEATVEAQTPAPEAVEPAPVDPDAFRGTEEYVTAAEVKEAVENPPVPVLDPSAALLAAFEVLQAKLVALEAKLAESAKPSVLEQTMEALALREGDRDKSTKLVEWPEGDDPNGLPPAQGDALEVLKDADRKPVRVVHYPGGAVGYHW